MKSKFFSPFSLVAQGFALGAILFFATGTPENEAQPQAAKAAAADVRSV